MKITDYPELIFDELPSNPENDKIYVLSGPIVPDSEFTKNIRSVIITTELIKTFLMLLDEPIHHHLIKPIQGLGTTVFGDSKKIHIRQIDPHVASGHVAYVLYREIDKRNMTLYINGLNEFGSLFDDKFLVRAIEENTIKQMYVDDFLKCSTRANTAEDAALAICKVLNANPGKRVHIEMDVCGHEDLLLELMVNHHQKLSMNKSRKILISHIKPDIENFLVNFEVAMIRVVPRTADSTEEFIEKCEEQNKICIRVLPSKNLVNNNHIKGLVYISHSQHPSNQMYQQLLQKFEGANVFQIYQDDESLLPDTEIILHPEKYLFEGSDGSEDKTFLSDSECSDRSHSFLSDSDDELDIFDHSNDEIASEYSDCEQSAHSGENAELEGPNLSNEFLDNSSSKNVSKIKDAISSAPCKEPILRLRRRSLNLTQKPYICLRKDSLNLEPQRRIPKRLSDSQEELSHQSHDVAKRKCNETEKSMQESLLNAEKDEPVAGPSNIQNKLVTRPKITSTVIYVSDEELSFEDL